MKKTRFVFSQQRRDATISELHVRHLKATRIIFSLSVAKKNPNFSNDKKLMGVVLDVFNRKRNGWSCRDKFVAYCRFDM
jgi:hypothetical protein